MALVKSFNLSGGVNVPASYWLIDNPNPGKLTASLSFNVVAFSAQGVRAAYQSALDNFVAASIASGAAGVALEAQKPVNGELAALAEYHVRLRAIMDDAEVKTETAEMRGAAASALSQDDQVALTSLATKETESVALRAALKAADTALKAAAEALKNPDIQPVKSEIIQVPLDRVSECKDGDKFDYDKSYAFLKTLPGWTDCEDA